jgi:hypothetical protein
MDRYQFEDLVSDYIENKISMSQRKQVEAYLEENPEANQQIDGFNEFNARCFNFSWIYAQFK